MASLARSILKTSSAAARRTMAMPELTYSATSPTSEIPSAIPNTGVDVPCSICDAPTPCDLCNSFGRDQIVAIFDTKPKVSFIQQVSMSSSASSDAYAPISASGNTDVTAKIHSLPGFDFISRTMKEETMNKGHGTTSINP